MSELSAYRRFLKRFHPEAIPKLGSELYNWISRSRVFQIQYELVTQDIALRWSEGRLLDVGTGPGWLLVHLQQQSSSFELLGLDISPGMVARAQHNIESAGFAGRIPIREGSADKLPFENGTFDVVLSTGSFHHWKNPKRGLNESYRVLKPGGSTLIYDLVADTPKSVIKQAKHEYGKLITGFYWLHGFEEPFYTERAFRRLGESSDFKRATTRYLGLLCCLELAKSPSIEHETA